MDAEKERKERKEAATQHRQTKWCWVDGLTQCDNNINLKKPEGGRRKNDGQGFKSRRIENKKRSKERKKGGRKGKHSKPAASRIKLNEQTDAATMAPPLSPPSPFELPSLSVLMMASLKAGACFTGIHNPPRANAKECGEPD